MSIDTVFVLSQTGDLIAMRTYKKVNRKDELPAFYANFVRCYKGSLQDREYPIMRIKEALYAFVTTSDVLVGLVVTEEVPILELFGILFHIVDVLKVSFAEGLTAERLRNNFSSIELMLDAMLDYGYPLITQKFVLESIIKPSGVIEKIEESLLGRHNMHKDQFQVLDKFVEQCADVRDHSQYRITDIRGDEEVFFDVIEYLDCVIDKTGRSITEEINGEIKMECNLSGVPQLYIYMAQPHPFSDFSMHECLIPRVDTFEREKVLNFIPPTGSTTIFYYNIKGVAISVPFDFIPRISFTDTQARVELKLANKPVRGQSFVVEEFNIKLITPAGLTLGETDMQSGQLTQLENALVWRIGRLEIDQANKLVATYTSKGNIKNGNFIACLKFLVNNFAASSTKIEKVEVRNGAKSLSKKAKNITKSGYYEIRLN